MAKKLNDLQIGDVIAHFCAGEIVLGTVIEVANNCVKTAHRPVFWAGYTYTESHILKSTELQRNSTPGRDTTPKAWHNGELITV